MATYIPRTYRRQKRFLQMCVMTVAFVGFSTIFLTWSNGKSVNNEVKLQGFSGYLSRSLLGSDRIVSSMKKDVYANDEEEVECRSFHDNDILDPAGVCWFIRNTSDCVIDDGFLDYLPMIYCDYQDQLGLIMTLLVILLIILFMALGITADEYFCPCLAVISDTMNLSQNVAGVTFLAFGNGAPDIFSAIAAISASEEDPGMAIGSLFGAAMFVTAVVAGTIAVLKPFYLAQRPLMRDLTFYLIAIYWTWTVLFVGRIDVWQSAGFIAMYLFYVFAVVMAKHLKRLVVREKADKDLRGIGKALVMTLDVMAGDMPDEGDKNLDPYYMYQQRLKEEQEKLPSARRQSMFAPRPSVYGPRVSIYAGHPSAAMRQSIAPRGSIYAQRLSLMPGAARRLSCIPHKAHAHIGKESPLAHDNPAFKEDVPSTAEEGKTGPSVVVEKELDTIEKLEILVPLLRPDLDEVPIESKKPKGRVTFAEPQAEDEVEHGRSRTDTDTSHQRSSLFDSLTAGFHKGTKQSSFSEFPTLSAIRELALIGEALAIIPAMTPEVPDVAEEEDEGDSQKLLPGLLNVLSEEVSRSRASSKASSGSRRTGLSSSSRSRAGTSESQRKQVSKKPGLRFAEETEQRSRTVSEVSSKSSDGYNDFYYDEEWDYEALTLKENIFGSIVDLLYTVSPINWEDFRENPWYLKIYDIIKAPLLLCLTITTPVVQYEDEEKHGWCKLLNVWHCFIAPFFILIVTELAEEEFGLRLWAYGLIVGAILAILVAFTSSWNRIPKYHAAFAYFGFVVAIVWIFALANEVVGLLQAFGVVINISNSILGLTFLAWGNSIGDFVANSLMAKQGFPRMAISACFGGPLFNLLLGIGIPFLIGCIPMENNIININYDKMNMVLVGAVSFSVLSSFIIIPLIKFRMNRPYGIYLLIIYVLFLAVAIMIELDVF